MGYRIKRRWPPDYIARQIIRAFVAPCPFRWPFREACRARVRMGWRIVVMAGRTWTCCQLPAGGSFAHRVLRSVARHFGGACRRIAQPPRKLAYVAARAPGAHSVERPVVPAPPPGPGTAPFCRCAAAFRWLGHSPPPGALPVAAVDSFMVARTIVCPVPVCERLGILCNVRLDKLGRAGRGSLRDGHRPQQFLPPVADALDGHLFPLAPLAGVPAVLAPARVRLVRFNKGCRIPVFQAGGRRPAMGSWRPKRPIVDQVCLRRQAFAAPFCFLNLSRRLATDHTGACVSAASWHVWGGGARWRQQVATTPRASRRPPHRGPAGMVLL